MSHQARKTMPMNKREIVEEYLNALCLEIETCHDMNDPYPCPTEDEDRIMKASLGLISYTQYEPGSDEWEAFYPEGWLYQTPSDEQVERLFADAYKYFND